MYKDIINTLSSDDYYKIKKDINKLINDSNFMDNIVKVHNPIVFDRFIKMCEYKIDTSVIYERRNDFIKKTLLNLNKDNIYDFFSLDIRDKYRERIVNRYLSEYIVSYYFGDNYYNFMTNFYQMVSYLRYTKKPLIDKMNIDLYKEFVNLLTMSLTDKVGFFKLLLDKDNIMEMFYEDMNTIRTYSHKELVESALKLNYDSDLYDKSISERLGVDVYHLDGEDFFGFVRCFSISRDDLSNNTDYINSSINRLGYSFSYIGKYNIGTSDYDGKSVVLFYDNIDYNDIMYVHHADLHAKKMDRQNDYLSEKENEILSPQSLIAKTKNYNEVYIKSKINGIKPKALICYGAITNNDIRFANKYDLAILLINRQKYKRYEDYDDEYDRYTYNI